MDKVNDGVSHWKKEKIGDSLKIVRGISFPKDTRRTHSFPDSIACLRTSNVQKEVEWDDLWFVPSMYVKRDEQIIRKNDILISTANSLELVGKVAQVKSQPYNSTLGAFISLIRVPPGKNPQFVYYQLSSSEVQNQLRANASTTTNISNISTSKLAEITLSYPSLDEQNRIVAKIEELFSQLDAGVAGLKRVQEGLKRYRASVLKAAFEGRLVPQDPNDEPVIESLRIIGKNSIRNENKKIPETWTYVKLSDIADINKKASIFADLPDNVDVTFVPMAAVDAEAGFISTPEIRKLGTVKKGFTSFMEGDVLFAKITPCMENGKAAIAKNLKNGIGFGSTEFHVLRANSFVLPEWLYHFVRQEYFRKDAKANFTGTAGQLRVPKRFLSDYIIPLPLISEQRRIVAEIESRLTLLGEVDSIVQNNNNRITHLHQAILKTAFEGKLDSSHKALIK